MPADSWSGYRHDSISRQLASLADQLERRLGTSAVVHRDRICSGAWRLQPTNPKAVGVAWVDNGYELILETLGGDGGRWETGRHDEDVQLIRDVVDAAIAGRITETFMRGGSEVTVTLADGTRLAEAGGLPGCLPRLLWPRKNTPRQYEPYV